MNKMKLTDLNKLNNQTMHTQKIVSVLPVNVLIQFYYIKMELNLIVKKMGRNKNPEYKNSVMQ